MLRVRVPAAKGNSFRASRLASELVALEGVTRAEANPLTGSVLVWYEKEMTDGLACLVPLRSSGVGILVRWRVDADHAGTSQRNLWKLDRLGRSLKNLIDIVNELLQRKVGLKSLSDPIDTTTSHGRLTFNIFASLAEFEKDVIRERTNAGLTAARARGRIGGRPKGLTPGAEQIACAAETLYREGKLSSQQIADRLRISKTTLYVYLRHRGVPISAYKQQAKT